MLETVHLGAGSTGRCELGAGDWRSRAVLQCWVPKGPRAVGRGAQQWHCVLWGLGAVTWGLACAGRPRQRGRGKRGAGLWDCALRPWTRAVQGPWMVLEEPPSFPQGGNCVFGAPGHLGKPTGGAVAGGSPGGAQVAREGGGGGGERGSKARQWQTPSGVSPPRPQDTGGGHRNVVLQSHRDTSCRST